MLATARFPGRRLAAGAAARLCESAWLGGFRLAGRFTRTRPAAWRPLGGGTVLVVAAHPDDETVSCGSVLLRHAEAGDRVIVLQVTDGRASRAGGLSADEMAARRADEARAAAEQLGAELLRLEFPEGAWPLADLVGRLGPVLRDLKPDVVYAPSPVDFHPEHLKVSCGLAEALQGVGRPLVRIGELGVPLTAALTNLLADVDAVEGRRRAVLAAYRTQAVSLAGLERVRRYNGAFWGRGRAIECFWELAPERYRAIVAAGDWSGRRTPYRGFRNRPFSDPLCYVIGLAERRRLADLAQS